MVKVIRSSFLLSLDKASDQGLVFLLWIHRLASPLRQYVIHFRRAASYKDRMPFSHSLLVPNSVGSVASSIV